MCKELLHGHRPAGVEHDLARHLRLRPQVQAVLLTIRTRPRLCSRRRASRTASRPRFWTSTSGSGQMIRSPWPNGSSADLSPRWAIRVEARDLRLDSPISPRCSRDSGRATAPTSSAGHDQQLLDRHRRPLHAPARQGRQRGLVREPQGGRPCSTPRAPSSTTRSAPPSTSRSTGSSWRRTPRSSRSATT